MANRDPEPESQHQQNAVAYNYPLFPSNPAPGTLEHPFPAECLVSVNNINVPEEETQVEEPVSVSEPESEHQEEEEEEVSEDTHDDFLSFADRGHDLTEDEDA